MMAINMPTVIGFELGNKILKKIISISLGKKYYKLNHFFHSKLPLFQVTFDDNAQFCNYLD